MKTKARRRLTVTDLYKTSELRDRIEWKEYKKVWDTFANIFFRHLLDTGKGYVLPSKLGTIQFNKAKISPNKKLVDFHATKKHNMTIFHTNLHSDGYYAYAHWDKSHPYAMFRNKTLYKLDLTRENKRAISRAIMDTNAINKFFENE